MLRQLTFSTLYPNSEQPVHGVFVEQRLRRLVATGKIEATVVAPVPWFPFRSEHFGAYGRFARVPRSDRRHGLDIVHPRYPLIPKIGMLSTPYLMAVAVLPSVRRLLADARGPTLLDAHYLYPDGVAAGFLSKWLGLPLVLTARGSDVNLIGRMTLPRKLILGAIDQSRAVITVSAALRETLLQLGADPGKLHVIRNGVDLEKFAPRDRTVARGKLGLSGFVALSAGKLDENKGHHLLIEALTRVPHCTAVIVGEGERRASLEQLSHSLGVDDRVKFAGSIAHDAMPEYYSAADCLVLASGREGMPNVVLEALASGLGVIATDVGGVSEVLRDAPGAQMLANRSSEAIAAALMTLRSKEVARERVRAYAEGLGWDASIEAQLGLLGTIAG